MQNHQVHTPLQSSQPLVSFIITCYNLPIQMLCECIDSILALSLTTEEREVIVVDDGSNTSPMNGLMQYGEEIVYIRQKNAGVSVARNAGMQIAKGKYIQIVDGDDALIKIPYEHCLDIIRTAPDTDAVLFDFTRDTNYQSSSSNFLRPKPVNGSWLLRNSNLHGAVWCCLFRQAVRSQLSFTPGICYAEDEEFMPQLLLRAEVVYATNVKAYYYRQRTTSVVHMADDASITKRLDDTHAVISHLQKMADRLPSTDRLALQRRVAQLTMDYLYNTIVLTRSRKTLETRIAALRTEGLFPLPDRNYSAKYIWFRRLSQSKTGRTLLFYAIQHLRRER
jgi:glycosyltransferase involved in cell wall biosynthesis